MHAPAGVTMKRARWLAVVRRHASVSALSAVCGHLRYGLKSAKNFLESILLYRHIVSYFLAFGQSLHVLPSSQREFELPRANFVDRPKVLFLSANFKSGPWNHPYCFIKCARLGCLQRCTVLSMHAYKTSLFLAQVKEITIVMIMWSAYTF